MDQWRESRRVRRSVLKASGGPRARPSGARHRWHGAVPSLVPDGPATSWRVLRFRNHAQARVGHPLPARDHAERALVEEGQALVPIALPCCHHRYRQDPPPPRPPIAQPNASAGACGPRVLTAPATPLSSPPERSDQRERTRTRPPPSPRVHSRARQQQLPDLIPCPTDGGWWDEPPAAARHCTLGRRR